jgi:membrane-associated protease RseP (regulator of RpoE activity)
MSEPTGPLTSTTDFYRPVQVWVEKTPKQRYWLHALLLLATFFTTMVVGARMEYNFLHNQPVFSVSDDNVLGFFAVSWALADPAHLLLGLPFAGTLMLILLAHEMGHYLYCKHYGVYATLPFFIPAPTLIGTLGAFIRIRSPIRSRIALFDIGIAGPIAGFVVSVAVLVVSLGLSRPLAGAIPGQEEVRLNYPLIFYAAHRLLAWAAPHSISALPLSRVYLHPTAVAAWVGMFATALNLLPGGQLDGGHIVFSVAPRAHRFVSRLTILILIPLAVYKWVGWLIWAILLEISSFRHPQVADWPRVTGVRAWLAVFALFMLILTLAPAPFADSSLSKVVHELWPRH